MPMLTGTGSPAAGVTFSTSGRTLTVTQAVAVDAALKEASDHNANDTKTAIYLPEYATVGDYWYQVVETVGNTVGVIYGTNDAQTENLANSNGDHNSTCYLHVQVTEKSTAAGTSELVSNIDYPILQGEDNLEYMNKDVYGGYSLAGSIFLDSRCDPNFEDRYSIIYGHNMDQHLMFGDLALYKDKDFFAGHTVGEIITLNGTQQYRVVAVLQIPAGTEEIFNPSLWKDGFEHFAEYLRQASIWYHPELLVLLESKPWAVQIAALVTCSSGSTAAARFFDSLNEKDRSASSTSVLFVMLNWISLRKARYRSSRSAISYR